MKFVCIFGFLFILTSASADVAIVGSPKSMYWRFNRKLDTCYFAKPAVKTLYSRIQNFFEDGYLEAVGEVNSMLNGEKCSYAQNTLDTDKNPVVIKKAFRTRGGGPQKPQNLDLSGQTNSLGGNCPLFISESTEENILDSLTDTTSGVQLVIPYRGGKGLTVTPSYHAIMEGSQSKNKADADAQFRQAMKKEVTQAIANACGCSTDSGGNIDCRSGADSSSPGNH